MINLVHIANEGRMMPALQRLLLAAFVFVSAQTVALAGSNSGADFLKIPIGAQGASLGSAFTATTEGVEALNWNPAGLAITPSFTETPSVGMSLSHQDHLADTNLDHLGLLLAPNGNRSTAFGLNVVRLSYGSQERRTADRQKVGSFDASDLSVGVAAARRVAGIVIGGQLKLIRQELAGFSAQGYAIDLGVQGAGPIHRMTYGVAVKNLGPNMKFVDEAYRLPLTLSIGGAYRVSGPLSISADVHMRPHQKHVTVASGLQYSVSQMVSLRAGYSQKVAEAVGSSVRNERGTGIGLLGLAGGFGIKHRSYSLDYAISPFGELGNAQTLTVSTYFGTASKSADREFDIESTTPAPQAEDDENILILPLENEKWWNNMR